MTTAPPPATLERHGAVGLITLNRPEARNAVNGATATVVGEALAEVQDDPSLRVAVITGTGPAFCAGMDLKAFAAGEDIAGAHPEWGFAGVTRHYIAKPVIAAVNGFAMGGGAEIVLAADLAVAARSATFALPEVARGLVAAAGGVFRLPRQVHQKLAMELVLTGRRFTAERALELGMVNRVVDDADVLQAALELAAEIAANAPLAVQASKQLVHDSYDFGSDWEDEAWERQDRLLKPVFSSADATEGATAFAEKRAPRWSGA
jgi:crotonobetainyl-CoA hydratase